MLRLVVSVRTGLQYAPVWVGNKIAGSSPILLWPVLEAGVVVELHIELNRSPWGLLWHERSSSSLNNFISSGSQTSSFPHQPVTARIPWMGQSSLRWEGDKAGQVQVPFSASLRPLGTSHDCQESVPPTLPSLLWWHRGRTFSPLAKPCPVWVMECQSPFPVGSPESL